VRLSKLKLAGFKSFVDPTVVLTPGQLVGVVGPNGCGKSNIIDAVRWVLGESRAGALRGESMMDVIFNGSTTRKPVSRSSVEMVFDNADGRAAGQWSQYGEISVRRVLDRSGESSYWINNIHVRRKDVIDLFLGTGLGPRAYAIIEQGMISRIIEAKPEEVRAFLEEAAGITKYKERRRETGGRLEDARDNLARVLDIRNELGAQVEKLEGQAQLARRYRTIQDELRDQQILLWLLKRNEAREQAASQAAAVAELLTRIEAENAHLQQAETRGEAARQAHLAASDALHAAQASLYEANAEVSRFESEIAHQGERRKMLAQRLEQLQLDCARWTAQKESGTADASRWAELEEAASLRSEEAQARHEEVSQRLPAAEEALAGAQATQNSLRHEIGSAEQQLKVEETRRAASLRSLDSHGQRRTRLDAERLALAEPDEAAHDEARSLAEQARMRQEALEQELEALNEKLPELQAASRAAQQSEREALRALTEAHARLEALQRIQKKVAAPGELANWLADSGLAGAHPLWSKLKVEAGWELAIEAVLRERFAALCLEDPERARAALGDEAPAAVLLAWPCAAPGAAIVGSAPGVSLATKVEVADSSLAGTVAGWLAHARAVEDISDHLGASADLAAGLVLVDRKGRVLVRGALASGRLHDATHGVLERQREIEKLEEEAGAHEARVEEARARLAATEEMSRHSQERIAALRRALQTEQQNAHRAQMLALELGQAKQRFDERSTRLTSDLAEIDEQIAKERELLEQSIARHEEFGEQVEALRERMDAAAESVQRMDGALRALRSQESSCAREVQEAAFAVRECRSKQEELARSLAQASEQIARSEGERDATEVELASLDATPAQDALQQALAVREEREAALAASRARLDEAGEELKLQDEARLRAELALRPLSDSLAEKRLAQQAAELGRQQFEERLAEIEFDEIAFAAKLAAGPKDLTLTREINRLSRELAEMGAVNLAAVDELTAAQERKGYLDAQSADLEEAIGTLEDAIRRIDRETREQLQETYNTVNRHFGELFPQLFGGGEAQLVLTGDEILDAGVQIIARPPGKKNSSIHLLSGGEKALTAIALVFSFFQLNPAPFCLLDEVDAPLDDANTERFCAMVKRMSSITQFLFISHSKITMELAQQLVGVTMQEQGVSRVVEVDIEEALRLTDPVAA
jgi:chromosome segregation protein